MIQTVTFCLWYWQLNQDTHLGINAFAVAWVLISAIGRTLHQCEKWSTHISRYLYSSQEGKGPVMLLCTCSKCSSGNEKVSTGACVCLPIFAFWHYMQDLDHSWICDFILGQTSLTDTVVPGLDKLCRLEKMVCHNDSRTKGHIFPVLVSHTTCRLLLGTCIFVKLSEVLLFLSSGWSCWSFSSSSTNAALFTQI